jgi:ABC-2 type transport system permease protein/sodium transport system permease protein
MPLLVYPLLSMTMQRFLLTSATKQEKLVYSIGVNDERVARTILENLEVVYSLQARNLDSTSVIERRDLGSPGTTEFPNSAEKPELLIDSGLPNEKLTSKLSEFRVYSQEGDWRNLIADGTLDLFLEVISETPPTQEANWTQLHYRVHYVENDLRSEQALFQFRQLVHIIDEQFATEKLSSLDRPPTWPLRLTATPVAIPKSGLSSLVTMIPLVLILMTITGAVYPAIDLTAGERERGTMEILIGSPAPRWALLFAKYVAVVSVALLTAIANLGSMFTTLYVTGLGKVLLGEQALSLAVLFQVFCLLILFAMFFSAVMLALTSFAKSFKEAQAYLIPVMLLALAPGVLSLVPGIEFTPLLACIPLVNIVLLARDLLLNKAELVLALAAIVSTMVYAAAAIGIAARLFGNDAIVHGSRGSWRELFTRPVEAKDAPRFDQMALFLAILFPCYFILSNLIGQLRDSSISFRLLLTMIITALLFGLMPWLYCRYAKIQSVPTFRLNFPKASLAPAYFLAALFLATSLWMAAHELFLASEWLGIRILRDDQVKAAQAMIAQFRSISPWFVLLSFAITPALFEEFFFRGFVFSSLNQLSRPGAILATAIIFGLFHVITGSVLAVERFLPTTLMGIFLGWLAFRTQSLWPGIVLHAVHNGLLLMTTYYMDKLNGLGIGVEEQAHLPVMWLVAGTIVIVITVGSIELLARPRTAAVPLR